jgi:hypothetical protein
LDEVQKMRRDFHSGMVQVLKHHCVAVKVREMLRAQIIKSRLPKDPWVAEDVRDPIINDLLRSLLVYH